ncbi:hypothetical protein MES4922_310015 [Mesorhizobium ventifaucium]|uniref:Uncharacterized protein n=1 Tax=Mesorhizobium ventifaucium TaxID=666020 RepID=A0ABN8JZY8_9HYPH|nr:hypothetical protein MES4922_310015 [Mesorhizobium ventifaucium]
MHSFVLTLTHMVIELFATPLQQSSDSRQESQFDV